MSSGLPIVSVIIAAREEAGHIEGCIEALAQQTYPGELLEVLLVDGASKDDTVCLATTCAAALGLALRVIDNPARVTPAAFNRGITAAGGDVVIILGARARVAPDFVAASVAALERTRADAVGGLVRAVADSSNRTAQAIALAQRSPFGVGDARYRYAELACEVDTVNYGAYRRDVFDRVGLFDESLRWVEDDELNYRLRSAGGRLLLDPAIRVEYVARGSLTALWRQRFLWGRNKLEVARRHPGQMRPRHAIPAIFVAALCGGIALAFLGGRWRWPLIGTLAAYTAAALTATVRLAARSNWPRGTAVLPVAFATMHLAYGWGTLAGIAALAASKAITAVRSHV